MKIPKRKWNRLSEALLAIGGHRVVVPESEPQIDALLKRGVLWKGKVLFAKKRKLNSCHVVSAWLWYKDRSNKLVTGYGLSKDDGLWRQHSFIVRDGTIIEPTPVKRNVYYGVALNAAESKRFFKNEKDSIKELGLSLGGIMRPRPFAKWVKEQYGREISENDLALEMKEVGLDGEYAGVKDELSVEGVIITSTFRVSPSEADWILERRKALAEGWSGLPKGWTMDSVKKFWSSLTGDRKHKITKCMEKVKNHIDNPGAFCASLARKVGYTPGRADMTFKITAQEKRFILKRRRTKSTGGKGTSSKLEKIRSGLIKHSDELDGIKFTIQTEFDDPQVRKKLLKILGKGTELIENGISSLEALQDEIEFEIEQ